MTFAQMRRLPLWAAEALSGQDPLRNHGDTPQHCLWGTRTWHGPFSPDSPWLRLVLGVWGLQAP